MSRVSGVLGFRNTPVEVEPGVFQDMVEQHSFVGEIFSNPPSTHGSGEYAQGEFLIHRSLSAVIPKNIVENVHNVIFVEFNNTRWVVQSCQVEHPRVVFKLGGVYND